MTNNIMNYIKNNKILIVIALILLILISGYFILSNQIENNSNKQIYQGSVPEGYDEDHFRKTGETKLLEETITITDLPPEKLPGIVIP